MIAQLIHTLVVYFIFGIGAGIRFLFFRLIGKKIKYNDLIEPKSQDKWNILVSIVIPFILIYLLLELDIFLKNRHSPIERFMY